MIEKNNFELYLSPEAFELFNEPVIPTTRQKNTEKQIFVNKELRAVKRRKRKKILSAKKILADALGFIKCAEIDIHASQVLYKEGIFSLAIYNLQQTVEKLVKADYLCTAYWEDELEAIEGHDSTAKMISSMEAAMEAGIVLGPDDSLPDIEMWEYIEVLKQQKSISTISLTEEEIQNLFNISDERVFQASLDANNIFFKKSTGVRSLIKIKKLWDNRNEMMESVEIAANIQLGSLLTDPHVFTTRYPNINRNKNLSPSDYTQSMGLVKIAPNLTKRMARTAELLRKQQLRLVSMPALS